jgi:integrase
MRERLLARLELPPATVHSLRHLAITRLDRLGVRTVVRKSIMGHAKDVHEGYSSVSDHDQRQALELAWRAMGQDEERRAAK